MLLWLQICVLLAVLSLNAAGESRTRAGVIGGGVGGLVVARNLAQAGFETTLIEAQPSCGGRMSSIHLLDKFRFDTGPSLLLLPEVYKQALKNASDVEMLAVNPFYRVYFENEEASYVDLEAEEGGIEQTLLRQIDPERTLKNVDSAFRRYKRIADSFLAFGLPAVIQEKFPSWQAFIAFLGASIEAFPLLSHDTMIRDIFGLEAEEGEKDSSTWTPGKKLRALLSFQDLYVGLSPSTTPAVFSLLQALEYSQGIYYPRGGFVTVANALEKGAREAGVTIKTQQRVKSLVVSQDSREVQAVVLHDTAVAAEVDVLVSNIDVPFAESSPLLRKCIAVTDNEETETTLDYSEGRARRAISSCSVVSLHIAFDCELATALQHHNLFLSPRIGTSWENTKDGRTFDAARGVNFYVHAPARTDRTACPEGCDAITVLVPVPPISQLGHSSHEEKKLIREVTQTVLQRLQACPGMPHDLASHILATRAVPPSEWQTSYSLHRGSVFGLDHSLGQLSLLRPRIKHPNLRNYFRVGASTRPGNGVPLVMIGAELTTRAVRAYDKRRRRTKEASGRRIRD